MTLFFEGRIVLDILIITIIIYSIFRTLQTTGTWKIAVGLGFAVILAVLARVLGLQGTEWIFSNFSPIALLMLLIIFQPEIRRILERSFFLSQLRSENGSEQLSDVIDQALFDLAERKWGALIVLPGKVPIKQWITEGIRLDGAVSLHLLFSIFDSGSPGHDGAVVIENERVDKFAVRLPLSQSGRLSNIYGTRHNAAMGLAEKTDALVFTVSEERGEISAFLDGNHLILKQRGDAGKLMADHFQQKHVVSDKGKKKKAVLPALAGFATSFAFAILLWTTLIQPRTELREMHFTVPIEYIKKDRSIVMTEKVTEAKLLIEGPIAALQSMDPSQFRIQVDVSKLELGRHKINLEHEKVVFPKKVKVLEIDPSVFEVEFTQLLTRSISIKPQIIGELPKGFVLDKIELSPPSVVIQIQNEAEEPLAELTTTPINISGLTESTTVQCKLIGAEGLPFQDKRVTDIEVRLTIEKK